MKNKIFFATLFILNISLLHGQITVSDQGNYEDPTVRKAYIFQYLNQPDILWDNGHSFMDLSLFIDNEF